MGGWYCPTCRAYVSPKTVTYAEVHENCNTPAIWIEDAERKEALYRAAPELYEALEVALDALKHCFHKYDSGLDGVCLQVEAALAKAKGETT